MSAESVPGEEADAPAASRVRRAARLVLEQTTAELLARWPAMQAGEPEDGIHRGRVAAKRLREALRLFRPALQPAALKPVIKAVDRLNDALGAVRDPDVLAELVAEYAPAQPDLADAFTRDLAPRRHRAQAKLVARLERLERQGLADGLSRLARDGRHDRDHPVAGERLRPFASALIAQRLDGVADGLRAVEGPWDAAGLHRARVVNKRLRYAIEPFAETIGNGLAEAYDDVVALHSLLGDLHDLDVLAGELAGYAVAAGRAVEAGPLLVAVGNQRDQLVQRLEPYLTPDGADAYAARVARCLNE